MTLLDSLFLLFFGYGCGSIPFGLILTRLIKKSDIRQEGSGNIGATNVFRCAGKALGLLTFFLDMLKGAIPVYIFAVWSFEQDAALWSACIVAVGVMLGHIFPIWLRFKGGKGVATFIGIMFGFSLEVGGIILAAWLVSLIVTRLSSASSLIMAGISPFVVLFLLPRPLFALTTCLLTAMIWIRHIDNLKRIWQGEEKPIIGSKKNDT